MNFTSDQENIVSFQNKFVSNSNEIAEHLNDFFINSLVYI